MKNILLIITLCITTSSMAMELSYFAKASDFAKASSDTSKDRPKKEKPNDLTTITCIKQPRYAQYLTDNRVVIAGEDGCSIVDPTTNKEIKRISDIRTQHLAIHPNKKLFALCYNSPNIYKNSVSIYDIEKNDFIWSQIIDRNDFLWPQITDRKIEFATFSPHDTTIFLILPNYYIGGHAIRKYNYAMNNNSRHENIDLQYNIRLPIITFNPTQNEMCAIHATLAVTFHEPDVVTTVEPKIKTEGSDYKYKEFCQYSPNGSYIAMGQQNKIYIVERNTISEKPIIDKTTPYLTIFSGWIDKILFYSNSVLAALSTHTTHTIVTPNTPKLNEYHNTLYYWDIHTKQLIHIDELLDISKKYDFSFSPDKTKVIIALTDKCIELPVPFNVIYKNITKKEFLYLLFLLKNYTSQCDDIEMPQDINILLAQTLLDLYKRE
jgi:hypothetical protein